MHELSVAIGIVRIAENETKKAHAKKVEKITLEIGTLAGIAFDALDFVWPVAVKDSILEHAKREIIIIDAKAKCNDCETIFNIDNFYDSCPTCSSNYKSIIQGKELIVKSLEIV